MEKKAKIGHCTCNYKAFWALKLANTKLFIIHCKDSIGEAPAPFEHFKISLLKTEL
jgi:hypothetical protein